MIWLYENWGKLILVILIICGVWYFAHNDKPAAVVTLPEIKVPTQSVTTKIETNHDAVVTNQSQPGAVVTFVEKPGKVVAVVGDKETEVINTTGKPDVKLGENGELRVTTTQSTKIDVTDMANAQARLIANAELEKQEKEHQKELQREKNKRKQERLLWIFGGGTLLYLSK